MNTTLRTPTADDFQTLHSWIEDAQACRLWAGPNLSFPFLAHELPGLLHGGDTQNTCHAMVDDDGNLLGFGQLFYRPENSVHLARLIIAPASRGQGLAKHLCQHLMTCAQTKDPVRRFTLNVYRTNLAALHTYTGLGFVTRPEVSREDVFFMELAVPAIPAPH